MIPLRLPTKMRLSFAIALPCASFIDGYLTKIRVFFAIALSLERPSFVVLKYKKREVARSLSYQAKTECSYGKKSRVWQICYCLLGRFGAGVRHIVAIN